MMNLAIDIEIIENLDIKAVMDKLKIYYYTHNDLKLKDIARHSEVSSSAVTRWFSEGDKRRYPTRKHAYKILELLVSQGVDINDLIIKEND